MTQKHRDTLDRLEELCETAQIHGTGCFGSQLVDLAAAFFDEQDIKNRCFSYLVATGQMRKYHETDIDSLSNQVLKSNPLTTNIMTQTTNTVEAIAPQNKVETIEVPAPLKECLIALFEASEKMEAYCPESRVNDCIDTYANKFIDLMGDAAYQIGEMIRLEAINTYFYKD